MTFRIISTGWNCADFLEQTLRSVEEQSCYDWEIMVVDDASTDDRQAKMIREWCDRHDKRWHYRLNAENLGTPRNQFEGIRAMAPDDEDIIVFLDLDGDRLAHPDALTHLEGYYADSTLVTYGSYKPVPDMGTSTPAQPFPEKVVRNGSYRKYVRDGNPSFNHLRTMKGKVFSAIPESTFHWDDTGPWYKHGTDYIFMVAALELADGQYKCIPETLLLYNHANPNADYLLRQNDSPKCVNNFLAKRPLRPLRFT